MLERTVTMSNGIVTCGKLIDVKINDVGWGMGSNRGPGGMINVGIASGR